MGEAPMALRVACEKLRELIRSVKETARHYFPSGADPLLDGQERDALDRRCWKLISTLDDLSGPFQHLASQLRWPSEMIEGRLILLRAAVITLLWWCNRLEDQWTQGSTGASGVHRLPYVPGEWGTPSDRLPKHFSRVDAALRDVLELALDDGGALAAIGHSPDFASIRVGQDTYTFTPKQRPVIAVLWSAWEHATCWVGHAHLQEAAETDGRIVDLFKGHPAWGKLIVKHEQTKDLFGLSMPESGK
jgi:hypothetical protein